ncbi:MAG: acetylglutamate kinase [Desulfovibrio sp.]|nr:acetylglutamate kinase [Desulfovibrio sp.]
MSASLAVIKYGGHAMDQADLAAAFATDLAQLNQENYRTVLVHGGGPQISSLLSRLGLTSRFVNGLRVTDEKTMEAVEMVLAGTVNKSVVASLAAHNVSACGISGRDAGLLRAEIKDAQLGRVGNISQVNPSVLSCLLDHGFVPVVAPIAQGPDMQALNVNADTAAGALAGALKAEYFVLISDVPGVLSQEGKLLPSLNRHTIKTLIQEQVITGGMIPKVEACLFALAQGAGKALILDGRSPSSLLRFLKNNEPLGTLVLP